MFFNGNFGHWALSVENNRLNYLPVGHIFTQNLGYFVNLLIHA